MPLPLPRLSGSYWTHGVALNRDQSLLATAGDDKKARVINSVSGSESLVVKHRRAVKGVALSPDGALMASASNDKAVTATAVESGAEVLSLQHGKGVDTVSFNRHGSMLASGAGKEINIYRIPTGDLVGTIQERWIRSGSGRCRVQPGG